MIIIVVVIVGVGLIIFLFISVCINRRKQKHRTPTEPSQQSKFCFSKDLKTQVDLGSINTGSGQLIKVIMQCYVCVSAYLCLCFR